MLFLFISLINSIFVPYNDPKPLVRTVSTHEAEVLSRTASEVIAISLSDDVKLNEIIIETLNSVAIYFENITFCVLDPESGRNLAKENEVERPAIFLYLRGVQFASYPYPDEDISFLRLCELVIKPPSHSIKSLHELYSEIGSGPFTILATSEQIPLARLIQYKIGSQMGIVELLNVDGSILLALGVSNKSMALVRKEDMNVVSIEMNADSIYDASNPVYRILINSDITGQDDIVVALICDDFDENEKEYLYQIGIRYPNFIVGYGNEVSDHIQKFNHPPNGDSSHEIVIFNLPQGIYYNASSYFAKLSTLPFNVENWVAATTRMLNDIENGKLEPTYLTEDPPDPTENDPYVSKIVGSTYESFIMDSERDVIVLYKRENCPHCTKFFPQFSKFAKECSDLNLTFLKFGFIDISKNSASIKFPYMPGVPHVQIFPAKNKTDDNPLRGGRDKNALMRLVKTYSSFTDLIPFAAPLPDKSQIALEMMQMLFSAKDMPEEEKIKTFMYIDKISKLINMTNKTKTDEL
ncbi:hypothetical protein M9Y10_004878 [Tritrichomonas musculus]|uniref:protein disulfide-isomerase n=1 Tax=Tritrichomonas musculus TaxID=1915356 RepID=A0ABR2JKA2_9EUKA